MLVTAKLAADCVNRGTTPRGRVFLPERNQSDANNSTRGTSNAAHARAGRQHIECSHRTVSSREGWEIELCPYAANVFVRSLFFYWRLQLAPAIRIKQPVYRPST